MGDPNSIDPYNDPHNDPMEFNFQDFMSDQNPTLADLETPENPPSPQFPFDDDPNNEDLIGSEDLSGDHDPIFEELVRTLREAESAGPSFSSPAQQLTGKEHNFDGVHTLTNQSVGGAGGGLLQPLQSQLQSLNTEGGGGASGSGSGSGGSLLPPLNQNQFENVSIQGGGAGGGLLQPLQHNQFSNLNTQGGAGGSGSLLSQFHPSRFQLQPSQFSMRNNETSNDGGGLIRNQFAHDFGGGDLLPPSQPSRFRLHYNEASNDRVGLIGTGSGSNLIAQGVGSMMPSQQNQMQIEISNSGSLLSSGIGGSSSNANSQEAGPSNRNSRRHPTVIGGSNADQEWDISKCTACQVIREINHTDGKKMTKLEIHGGLLDIHHIVTKTYEQKKDTEYGCFGFAGMGLGTVKTFLLKYCDIRREAGFIMLHDRFSEFYDTLSVELYRPPSRDLSDDQPLSLSRSGDRRRLDGASGSGSGGGNEQDRGPSRSNLARQRERTGKLTLADLSCYFHLPMEEAASRINLCLTVLKKICRRSGMKRWPHRRIQSLNKRIQHYQERLNSFDAEQKERAWEIIRICQEELDHIYNGGKI